MFDEKFRTFFSAFGKVFVKPLILLKISPNQITILGFILALVACYFVSQKSFLFGITLWWISRFFDGLDGLLARESNCKTAFGGYLDILLDMFAYSAMILAFAYVHSDVYSELNLLWNLILISYVLCITSTLALSSIMESLSNSTDLRVQKIFQDNNRSLKFTTGLAEAGETSIAYTLFVFVPLLFPQSLFFLAAIWLLMVSVTVLQRTYLASKILKGL